MIVESDLAACIGEPARARMLYALLDARARTSTELSLIGEVSASTASVHLARLTRSGLLAVHAQGKHRYFRLAGAPVANALEALSVLAGGRAAFNSTTPEGLRAARTCYDHMAGAAAVAWHDRLIALGWLGADPTDDAYHIREGGSRQLRGLGIDVAELESSRRRLAYACLDWSERKPHIGGALGAALLSLAVRRRWVRRHPDERRLTVTPLGRDALQMRGATSC